MIAIKSEKNETITRALKFIYGEDVQYKEEKKIRSNVEYVVDEYTEYFWILPDGERIIHISNIDAIKLMTQLNNGNIVMEIDSKEIEFYEHIPSHCGCCPDDREYITSFDLSDNIGKEILEYISSLYEESLSSKRTNVLAKVYGDCTFKYGLWTVSDGRVYTDTDFTLDFYRNLLLDYKKTLNSESTYNVRISKENEIVLVDDIDCGGNLCDAGYQIMKIFSGDDIEEQILEYIDMDDKE